MLVTYSRGEDVFLLVNNDSLHHVKRDVQRLLGFLKDVNFEESAIVRAVLEQGRLHRHLVVLVKMLLEKNKIGIVEQVLEEFERIYDELCGMQAVLVSFSNQGGGRSTVWDC